MNFLSRPSLDQNSDHIKEPLSYLTQDSTKRYNQFTFGYYPLHPTLALYISL